jgi:pimeloyl-ACP methyl ester carboxylesterase
LGASVAALPSGAPSGAALALNEAGVAAGYWSGPFVDRGMRWGFAWDLGPFETWDAIGVAESVAKMHAEGRTVPAWIEQMLASGRLIEDVARYRGPLLVACGSADTVTPEPGCRAIAAAALQGEYRSLPGLGHACYAEDPATVNALLATQLPAVAETASGY